MLSSYPAMRSPWALYEQAVVTMERDAESRLSIYALCPRLHALAVNLATPQTEHHAE